MSSANITKIALQMGFKHHNPVQLLRYKSLFDFPLCSRRLSYTHILLGFSFWNWDWSKGKHKRANTWRGCPAEVLTFTLAWSPRKSNRLRAEGRGFSGPHSPPSSATFCPSAMERRGTWNEIMLSSPFAQAQVHWNALFFTYPIMLFFKTFRV